ncbi:hypothetical protein [Hydromonas duriensis]|uniref:Portal protein n=1 Tax=Hydromonas duriensis TaxID=1527608 RepID=A0A4R6Y278_9BURK|nr:hypothetical protein [Hydromonas duriensis]TDR30350.1 hypothetical protein DFR44_12219 [Hydromonas duriensis]
MQSSSILDANGQAFSYASASDIQNSGYQSNTQIDAVSISQVLSSFEMPSRVRWEVYKQYLYMMSDPIISAALNLHVTQSLGGHETTGEVIFIESKPTANAKEKKLISEINTALSNKINEIAYQIGYVGIGMGDAYARLYGEKGNGIIHIDTSEFYLPPLVQSFEKGGRTVGYEVSVDNRELIPLTVMQVARLKMPRMLFVPQPRAQYNQWKQAVAQDDFNALPNLPALVGGSFLEAAEKPFFLLQSALTGLSSSRILDSVRESMFGVNMQDMTHDQQKEFFSRVSGMLMASKKRAADAIKNREPVVEKIFHLIPTWREKQLYAIDAGGTIAGGGNAKGYDTDDVMLYAKLLAGALGLDLSMLGFSDILSGGLGEGGFFRVSAQSAHRARMLRQAMSGFVHHVIDVHCQYKYGGIFSEADRPYTVNFVGSSSAQDREQQEVQERKMAASATLVQIMQQMKDLGLDSKTATHLFKEQLGFDEDDAVLYGQIYTGEVTEDGTEPHSAETERT